MAENVIQNADVLGTTQLRRDALAILEAGYKAIDTKRVVEEQITRDGDVLTIQNTRITLTEYKHIFIVGIGKCALDACSVLDEMLEDRLSGGAVLDVRGGVLKKLKSHIGTHPLPSEHNVEATKSIADLVDSLSEDDLLITVISGGGSALLCLPNDLQCSEFTELTDTLMNSGATIAELNTVRKHTSKIQGGQLAARAYPARVLSLIFSDVPGDDLSTIASGPTVRDETTVTDAQKVFEKYQIPHARYSLLETPEDDKYFERVQNILLLSNKTALEVMAGAAEKHGYSAEIKTTSLEGDAQKVARQLLDQADTKKHCNLYGGEVTVRVHSKNGKGGRNQHLALAALKDVPDGVVLIAAASDGWDNSDVAGALADADVRKHAQEQNISLDEHLRNTTSYHFFHEVGGHITTGKTGANVADFYITLHA